MSPSPYSMISSRRPAPSPRSPACKPSLVCSWVTDEEPYGECGLHREAQFTGDGSSWSYSARYKVLNESDARKEHRCNEIKEQELVYVSRQSDDDAAWFECETLRFEPGCASKDFPCIGGTPTIAH